MLRADTEPWKALCTERRVWAYQSVPIVGRESFDACEAACAVSIHPISSTIPVLDPYSLIFLSVARIAFPPAGLPFLHL